MFHLTKRVSFLRQWATRKKNNQLKVQKTNVVRGFFSLLLVVLKHVVLGISMSVFWKKQSLGFILVRLSDFEERDHLFSSCEVQVKVHSLHGRVLLTNRNQGPKIKYFISKMWTIPKQTRKGPAAKFHQWKELGGLRQLRPGLGRNGSSWASCPSGLEGHSIQLPLSSRMWISRLHLGVQGQGQV